MQRHLTVGLAVWAVPVGGQEYPTFAPFGQQSPYVFSASPPTEQGSYFLDRPPASAATSLFQLRGSEVGVPAGFNANNHVNFGGAAIGLGGGFGAYGGAGLQPTQQLPSTMDAGWYLRSLPQMQGLAAANRQLMSLAATGSMALPAVGKGQLLYPFLDPNAPPQIQLTGELAPSEPVPAPAPPALAITTAAPGVATTAPADERVIADPQGLVTIDYSATTPVPGTNVEAEITVDHFMDPALEQMDFKQKSEAVLSAEAIQIKMDDQLAEKEEEFHQAKVLLNNERREYQRLAVYYEKRRAKLKAALFAAKQDAVAALKRKARSAANLAGAQTEKQLAERKHDVEDKAWQEQVEADDAKAKLRSSELARRSFAYAAARSAAEQVMSFFKATQGLSGPLLSAAIGVNAAAQQVVLATQAMQQAQDSLDGGGKARGKDSSKAVATAALKMRASALASLTATHAAEEVSAIEAAQGRQDAPAADAIVKAAEDMRDAAAQAATAAAQQATEVAGPKWAAKGDAPTAVPPPVTPTGMYPVSVVNGEGQVVTATAVGALPTTSPAPPVTAAAAPQAAAPPPVTAAAEMSAPFSVMTGEGQLYTATEAAAPVYEVPTYGQAAGLYGMPGMAVEATMPYPGMAAASQMRGSVAVTAR